VAPATGPVQRTRFPIGDLMPVLLRFIAEVASVSVVKIERHFSQRSDALGVGIVEQTALAFMLNELVPLFLCPFRFF
jgi:hypothetical protein